MQRQGSKGLVAVYPGPEEARRGLDALEAAGIEGSHIALSGNEVARAAAKGNTTDRDAGVLKGVVSRTVIWGLAGVVGGGLVGLLLGLAFFGFTGTIAAVLSGALAGGSFSAVMGGMSRLDMSEDWELAHERDGKTVLRLYAESDEEVRVAERALRGTEPVRVIDLTEAQQNSRRSA